jgi:hypothetical protein
VAPFAQGRLTPLASREVLRSGISRPVMS